MVIDELYEQIKENFQYLPTKGQEKTLKLLSEFLLNGNEQSLFLLKGYAGTGKTSLVAALVRTLNLLQRKTVLMAPTGRAVKVFSSYAHHPAYTIHKMIYRQRAFSNELDNFVLNDNLMKNTLFIVDEASMISNDGLSGDMAGGRLLDDLISFVYNGMGCRLLLMGDDAQLPPVGEEESPALSTDVLVGYGLDVVHVELTDVVRQELESGILWNATELRNIIREGDLFLPPVHIQGFSDIKCVPGPELIEAIEHCYDVNGIEDTMIICRSNKRANLYNKGIRNQILWREEELSCGDMVMLAKNNYYWTKEHKDLDFLANGEIMKVKRVRNEVSLYGFRFVDATLVFMDNEDVEIEAKVLLDTLHSDAPALTKEESDRLFMAVWEDYPEISSRRERMKKIKDDPYYNALQIKYAYAITGHKAQGGQWKNVFVDQAYVSEDYITPNYLRWIYTIFTRATDRLFLVNYPKDNVL